LCTATLFVFSFISPHLFYHSWQWDARANASLVKGNVAHTCRKFDKITEWAKQRVLVNAYDPTVHIKDDIVVPILHQEMS
jgi:hypothetical protein